MFAFVLSRLSTDLQPLTGLIWSAGGRIFGTVSALHPVITAWLVLGMGLSTGFYPILLPHLIFARRD